jgi:hypothetical protein
MLVILLIFIVGLTPAVISAYLSIRAEREAKRCDAPSHYASPLRSGALRLVDGEGDLHYVDGMGYMVGDITCDLNARSPYLRCAVNPMGPCDGCSAYAPRVFDRQM